MHIKKRTGLRIEAPGTPILKSHGEEGPEIKKEQQEGKRKSRRVVFWKPNEGSVADREGDGSVKAADRFRKVRTDHHFLQVEVSRDVVCSSLGGMVV